MSTDEFKHESLQDPESVGDYLKAIIVGLEAGCVDLSDDNGQVVLHPTGLLALELRAKRRGNRSKLRLELSWTEDASTTRSVWLRVGSDTPT